MKPSITLDGYACNDRTAFPGSLRYLVHPLTKLPFLDNCSTLSPESFYHLHPCKRPALFYLRASSATDPALFYHLHPAGIKKPRTSCKYAGLFLLKPTSIVEATFELYAVVHVELTWVSRHTQALYFFVFQFDEAVDHVVIKHTAFS
jgi:hypothetical protein